MVQVNYKELKFFKKSHEFTLEVYKITKEFPNGEKFGLISQIRRASSSIPGNIAEGSAKSQGDFKRFLGISLGSAKECEYWLLLAKDLEYISINSYDRLLNLLNIIIGSLINYIKRI